MRICTVSHSHIALRQQLFFKEVARQGHDVLMISPGMWFDYKVEPQEVTYPNGKWQLKTCRHMNDNIYEFTLLGAKELVSEFKPDWLYIQQEPGSTLAREGLTWKAKKRAIFTWENISIKGMGREDLKGYDLVICGNPEAEELAKVHNPHTALILQVGVDTDHFQARPINRIIDVGYIGRPAPEKGIKYVVEAWPTVHILKWTEFRNLPWFYSQIKIVVCFSQDTFIWRVQAPNYVALEALSCGCKCIISDTAAMKYWIEG